MSSSVQSARSRPGVGREDEAVRPLLRLGRDLPAQVHDPSHQRFSFRIALRDHQLLDLAGPLVDAERAHLAVQTLHRRSSHDSRPPWICTARSTTRWAISVAASLAVAASRVMRSFPWSFGPGRVAHEQARPLEVHVHLGQGQLRRLELGEGAGRTAGGPARSAAASSKARAARPQAAAPTLGRNVSSVARASAVALAFLARAGRRGPVEVELAQRMRGHGLERLHREVRGLRVDQEHREAVVARTVGGAGEHRVEPGDPRVRDVGLHPVEPPEGPVAGGAWCARPRGRSRLPARSPRSAQSTSPCDHRGQPAALLRRPCPRGSSGYEPRPCMAKAVSASDEK